MDKDLYLVRSLGCQYLGPDYDPRDRQQRTQPTPYCGCKSLVGTSVYCAEHYPKMYQKGTALRRRAKDIKRAASVREWESLFNEAVSELESEGYDFDLKPIDEVLA
jgi:hypothetical protein